jgi:hypothetical protein
LNERCWVLAGRYDAESHTWRVTAHREVSGRPSQVEADWAWALAREDERGDVVGFWHTHPAGAGRAPSPRDIRTMQAWCLALGKPLLCLISEEGRLGPPAAHLFVDEDDDGLPAGSVILQP